ncbi:glycoside hydrolase family 16 protein [Rhodococcus erythropolis]|uniref:glycoside hydrolase family 16 protein n=1 Tax=Rhodococcus erythropolis TaxID=1833 RepID=UPI0008B55B4D|nr:glycoside hydrolase family 16 protein [Rhodococcus erythropolis]OFV73536.1 endo-1,3-1,4-beta-glycanase ExsH [Rhodococcus erythropolis]
MISRERFSRRSMRIATALATVGVAALLVVSCDLKLPSFAAAGSVDTAPEPPSGVPAPQGDIPGWRQIFRDDFTNPTLGGQWSRYSGTPGGDPYSQWSPQQVHVEDGMLTLESTKLGGRTVTGGVSNWPRAQKYGKWDVRFRADASDDVTFHFLLWPQNEQWPPEIDFAESFGGPRQHLDAFVHWVDAQGIHRKNQQSVSGDFTQWNTVGVEWVPGEIRYTLNGAVWGVERGDRVPDLPMWLGLQAQAGGCEKAVENVLPGCPVAGSPASTKIEIDWVSVYAPA